MCAEPFCENLNSLSWVTVTIYIAKFLATLYQCVLETWDRIFWEYGSK